MRKRIPWRRWRVRLIAWAIVIALAVLAAVAVFIYLAYQQTAADLILERDRQLAFLSAGRLKDELGGFAGALSSVAREPEIYGGSASDRQTALQQASARLAVFDGGVVLLDNFGQVQAAEPARPALMGADWSGQDFFAPLLSTVEPVFVGATNNGPDNSLVATVTVPVLGEHGEFAGALAGMFRLGEPKASSFYASIVRLRLGQTGNTFLVDGAGRILYDSNFDGVGVNFNQRVPYGLALQDSAGATRARDNEGHEIVAARATVPGTDWMLVAEDDWAALSASANRYANILAVILALSMALPAIGVWLLVRERNAQLAERERNEQELRTAELIQRTLIPHQPPVLPGWNLSVHYRPAVAGGGDFYDFVFLPDGRLMLSLADIADRSPTATMAMATARAALRGAARRMLEPAKALEESNLLLCPEMQDNMCIFAFFAVLDPASGELCFANAGHLPPYRWHKGMIDELRIPGRPLGLLLETQYDQGRQVVQRGECVVLYSNGLAEARGADNEMFGVTRLQSVLARQAANGQELLEAVLTELAEFAGPRWQQADDITLIVLERAWSDA